mmetsp:Transcript_69807/g.120820  ORF Transcript_69807/g.120820 Transcript_69807/m.120820 type:complete len:106 (+) Transcript_69807:138-455(+)
MLTRLADVMRRRSHQFRDSPVEVGGEMSHRSAARASGAAAAAEASASLRTAMTPRVQLAGAEKREYGGKKRQEVMLLPPCSHLPGSGAPDGSFRPRAAFIFKLHY